MKNLKELAIYGFIHGADNYGESIVGVNNEVYYSKLSDHFRKTVLLKEPSGHSCTSSIGFYIDGDELMVYSSKEVTRVPLTSELRNELSKAIFTNT